VSPVPKTKQICLITFFSSVFTQEDLNQLSSAPNLKIREVLDDFVFTEADVLSLLRKLDVTKSPGPDNIHPRVLKECADVLVTPSCLFCLELHCQPVNYLRHGKLLQSVPYLKKDLVLMSVIIHQSV